MARITKNAVTYDAVQVRSLTNGPTVEVYATHTFINFLQGLLQKDPQQRLSWPQLLYHPFVEGVARSPAANAGFTRGGRFGRRGEGANAGADAGAESGEVEAASIGSGFGGTEQKLAERGEVFSYEMERDHPDGSILTPVRDLSYRYILCESG